MGEQQSKRYTALSEQEALQDMEMTEKYLLERYRNALGNGGSARVRECLLSCFGKTANDLNDIRVQEERLNKPETFVREEEEKKIAAKYKQYVKKIENSTKKAE